MDAGRGSGHNGLDILEFLSQSRVQLWLHDLGPIYALIANVALKQFSSHRDSIKVRLLIANNHCFI